MTRRGKVHQLLALARQLDQLLDQRPLGGVWISGVSAMWGPLALYRLVHPPDDPSRVVEELLDVPENLALGGLGGKTRPGGAGFAGSATPNSLRS